ncbi:hypothetical protein [Aquimarina sp. 2201CG5-10]|uniref:hypothetical protein n=1 Tax=Aquimarina callyspongiae TaxID=3098150 RepID=UPI002AB507AB|nr:hypothetical protein [Aquimarina sp. 2201CG5-10]MDY8138681.1 hypothetical protein [Aquimarina sp. 2201CG5-10]
MNIKTKNINVFIAISPSHILNFESIIKSELHSSGSTILLNPGNFKYETKLWDNVINGNMDLTYTVSSGLGKIIFQLKKISGYKKYLKKIKREFSLKSRCEFYYCNLDDILTNHIFQIFKTNTKNTFYVVEDGILNYYHPDRVISTLSFKKKLCRLYNLRFEIFLSHPTNISANIVNGQYVRIPEKAICSEKSIKLPFEQILYKPFEDVVLIIGQDIMHNCEEGEAYYEKRLDLLFKRIKEQKKGKKVVYKPHRNGDISIAKKLLKQNFENYELFLDNTPIEDCIPEIAPLEIYSFESSAILNLKIALKDSPILFTVLPFNDKNKNLITLYKELGVNIFK